MKEKKMRKYKIQKERLTNELFKTLNKFQEAQKATMQKQKESNERAKANMAFNVSKTAVSYDFSREPRF